MSINEIDLELNILNLMLNEAKQSYIIENLDKRYFTDTINSVIFDCAKQLYYNGNFVDIVLLGQTLQNNDVNERLIDITEVYPLSINTEKYCKMLADKYFDKLIQNAKTKKVVPLTDDYIKSLENYMNNENPKIRLIGAKEVLERFKEDENRKDNPSLMALLNKALRDTSPSVRFLALTSLQLGYAVGNNETVSILREIQSQNTDKIGEDALLASEILLKMSQGQKVEVPMTQNEVEKAEKNQAKQESK